MLENFIWMAEPKTQQRMHGHYLCGGFNTQGNEGPDATSIWWYNRNLRIFNKILPDKTQPGRPHRGAVRQRAHTPCCGIAFTRRPNSRSWS